MISRRAIMQAIGMASVSLPTASVQLPAMLASPSTTAAIAFAKAGQGPSTLAPSPPNPISQTISRLCDEFQREVDTKSQVRYRAQFDGDIQALRSVSLVNKQRMQFEREMAMQHILMQAYRVRFE